MNGLLAIANALHGWGGEREAREALESPDVLQGWAAAGPGDWRSCLPESLRELWGSLSFEGKLVAYLAGEAAACQECRA